MTALLFFARAIVVLSAALLAALRLRRAPASTRRLLLALSLLVALLLPAVSGLVPRSVDGAGLLVNLDRLPLLEGGELLQAPAPVLEESAAGAPLHPYSLTDLMFFIYALGALLVLGRTLGAQLKARALAREGRPFAPGIVLSPAVDVPAVVGVFSATVLLPIAAQTWSDERTATVLLHERAHIRQRDGLVLLISRVACALYWPLPLVWLVARRLRRECELAADERVVRAGVAPTTYASELIALSRAALRPTPGAAFGMASELESRVRALLGPPARAFSRLHLSALWVLCFTIAAASCFIGAKGETAHAAALNHDPRLQAILDEEAARALSEWSAESVVAVALDPRTGALLASVGEIERPVVPGSTMKPFAVAAALDADAIRADGSFRCDTSPRHYGQRTLRDGRAAEQLDLGGLLAVSSNVCTSHLYDELGGAALLKALRALHFGERPGALPASLADKSLEGALVATGVGVSATPLQLAAAYASLSDGEYRAPSATNGQVSAERVMSEQTARRVRELLAQVIYSPSGTGRAAAVAGVRVVGKTGTSELGDAASRATYASFAGLAPADAPRLVVYVGISAPRGGATGGKAAAPMFARIVRRALER